MNSQTCQEQRLTIKDVARHLGVSTATISNAFNRPDQLSVQLRERILSECKQLGYRSQSTTASRTTRANGRSGIIGVVTSDCLSYNLSDPVANQFLTGITEVFDDAQLNMLMLSARDFDSKCQLRMHESMVDGFIVHGQIESKEVQEHLTLQRKPLITVDYALEGHSSIQIDNFGGALSSARHALQHQPERPAVLGLRLIDSRHVCRVYDPGELFDANTSISVQRLHGYRAAFAECNRQILHDRVWHIPVNSHASARQAAREALLSHQRPDLLLCMSDTIALAALQEAQSLGIRVPDELHIVGFDGAADARNCYPSLTTVHQDTLEKGRLAGRFFLEPDSSTEVILPTELWIGGSCPHP